MGILKEFRDFAVKGNAVDLAVGVIVGGAFGKIVDSIVNDLIMPVVGILFKADFSNLYLPLSDRITEGLPLAEARKLGPVLAWGNFITIVLNFVILAFVVFWLVKTLNNIKKKEVALPEAPTISSTDQLLTEIRDALKK